MRDKKKFKLTIFLWPVLSLPRQCHEDPKVHYPLHPEPEFINIQRHLSNEFRDQLHKISPLNTHIINFNFITETKRIRHHPFNIKWPCPFSPILVKFAYRSKTFK